jgi:predicted transcriptional regulator
MRPRRKERFAIRLDTADKVALTKLAREEDVTLTHLIRRAIRDVINRRCLLSR